LTREPWHHDGRSRHERGYGAAWVKTRSRILKRDGYLCQTCKREGRLTPATAVDHVKPKAKGGTDDDDNLASICAAHHAEKSAREAAEGRGYRPKRKIGLDGWPME
jgi:5-methylcytosine-specific restriction enzyme A